MSSRYTRAGLALSALVILGLDRRPGRSRRRVPFTDPNAVASIGLCDAHGNPISSGSIDSHAFVVAAGASSAAPDGYGVDQGGKATLYAFQPRQNIDPGEWSGFELTGGSVFSDNAHPLVSGTNLDPSLREFTVAYPVKWNGLVQLRMYYTAPNKVPSRDTYPAAVLRVSGDHWTVVQGSSMHCDLSKVVSSERMLLPAAAFDSRHPAVTHAPAPAGASSAADGPAPSLDRADERPIDRSRARRPAAACLDGNRPGRLPPRPNTSSKSERSSTNPTWWILGAVLVVAAAGAGIWRRARSR